MKSLFSRRHDTQTGNSKSAATYKFWIPNADPDRKSSKPTSGHESAVEGSSSRPQGEKRSSNRAPKPSQPVPMPPYDRPIPSTSAAISGQTTEYIRQNMVTPSNQYYQQQPTNVTSTRTRDYDDARLQPPPRPPSRPSHLTRSTIIHDIPTKGSRYVNVRNESTAPIQHQVWIPTVAPSVARQPEAQKKPVQEGDEAVERFRSRYDENDRPPENSRRDRDRHREKEKERPREREGERDRVRHGERERERVRVREKDRERERDQETDREQERVKEREREREREKERDRLERDKERERERERERLERLERDKERERLEREREREREKEREREREKEREREREKERERERERDRHRERERERERAARHAERDRREREREKEKARIREREWDSKVKERDNEVNRESPTAKGKERAREERPMVYDHPEKPSEGTRSDPRVQDRDFRKDRENRTTRDSENHRARDRDRDQPRYRAEATDGEQDLRRTKPRTTERDKRKDVNQGWVSDNYAAHERRPSRTVNPEPVPVEEAESSDSSLRPKHGVRMVSKRARVEEAILSTKPPRSRQDRPPDFRSSLLPPNVPQPIIYPIVMSDAQAPVTSTPLSMPVHLPPKDMRTGDDWPIQQMANVPVWNEPTELHSRREINRSRLNEPPSLPNETATRVTEQSSSTNHRRPPSHISTNPHLPGPPQTGHSYSSRNDHSTTLSRQHQSLVSNTQTNATQQSDLAKDVLPRSEWPRDQRLHLERPSEPTLHPRVEPMAPPLAPLRRVSVDHSLSIQLATQEKLIIDPNAKHPAMVPSEGYSRSRLNSLTSKPQHIPSSSQVNIIPTVTVTQDSRDIAARQISVAPSEGRVRSRLNSLSAKPEPLPISHQNVPNPAYLVSVEQPSVAIAQFSAVDDEKEAEKKAKQLKAALESILLSENPSGTKQPVYNERDVAADYIMMSNERPQMQTESSHLMPNSQNVTTSLQPIFAQSAPVPDTGSIYNMPPIQRPPTASGQRDDLQQSSRNLLSLGTLGAERPTIVQASISQTSKPFDILPSNHHRQLCEVDENRVIHSHEFQNTLESQKFAPRVVSLNAPSRIQEPNDQEKVGLSLSRPPTSLGQNGGRTLKHSGVSIANPSAYPEIIRVLPSLQPADMVTDPPQVAPSASGNGTSGVESSALQVPSNVTPSSTRATNAYEHDRYDTILINKSSTREQESPKVLRHQRPAISQSDAYPAPFREPTDSFPVMNGTGRYGSILPAPEIRVDLLQPHPGARPSVNPTYSTRIAIPEVQSEAHNPATGGGTRFIETGDNLDRARIVQNRDASAIHLSSNKDPYPPITQPLTYGQTVIKEDNSPIRRPQLHLGSVVPQSSKISKEDSPNGNVDTGSQTIRASTQPMGYAQKSDKIGLTDLRVEQLDVPSLSSNDTVNSKRESPTVRNRPMTATSKVELQIPLSLNTKQDSPRGTHPTMNTPGFGPQTLPPVNSEYISQRPKHDSRQDSPKARVEHQGSPNKRLPDTITQTPLLHVKAVEQSIVQPESRGNQLPGFDVSAHRLPRSGPGITESVVPQERPSQSTGDYLARHMEGGMIGNSSQHGSTKTSVDLVAKPTEDGYLDASGVPQLRIPKHVSTERIKTDQAMRASHSTPRVAPLTLNVEYSVQAPASSAKISASVVNDPFPGFSENIRSRTPHINNNHEAFLARRAELKLLNSQLANTPKHLSQAIDSTHVPATHHRTASGSKQNPFEASGDPEPVSLGFFSPAFSSALYASGGKMDPQPAKMIVTNEQVNPDSRPGKALHNEAADHIIQTNTANTAKISDTRPFTRDGQVYYRPDGEQREATRFHRTLEIVKKEDEIEKVSRPPPASFTHPVLAEILSSPPPARPPPMTRYQNAASVEQVGGTDHRMGASFNNNAEVHRFHIPPSERAQPNVESTRPPISRRHGSFQAMPGGTPGGSKEDLVQDNRPHGSKVSNVVHNNVSTGSKESFLAVPLPSSNLASGPMANSDVSMKEPVLLESRTHGSRPANPAQVNQGGKDYLYGGPASRATSTLNPTGPPAPVQRTEPGSLTDTNPHRGFVGRSGLETHAMGYDKRGHNVPPIPHTQSNENRGTMPENRPASRAYPSTAEFRPQQVPQSYSSSTHLSNRHQHSSSLPVSFAPSSGPQSFPKTEDSAPQNPRTSTYRTTSHYQTTFTPFQTNTFPVNMPATDASIVSIPNAPSDETLLKTPSSLAHSMMLKPSVSRQSATPSVGSQTAKKGGIFNKMFRRTSTPAPAPAPVPASNPQYEVWHPPANAATPDSSPGHGKSTRFAHDTQFESSSPKKAPPAVEFSIPVQIHGQSEQRKGSNSHVFSPFKYLTGKRHRTVSIASLEAQPGTSSNTVIGSPTASTHSQNLLLPPPSRDPLQATHEWRNKEEAGAKVRAKARLRRQPPGVVFDVGEEVPEDGRGRPRRMRTRYRSSSAPKQTTAEPAPQT